jgi:hypothetical protein
MVAPADDAGTVYPEIAPDARRLAVARTPEGNRSNIWFVELKTRILTRFTSDSGPDATRVVARRATGRVPLGAHGRI